MGVLAALTTDFKSCQGCFVLISLRDERGVEHTGMASLFPCPAMLVHLCFKPVFRLSRGKEAVSAAVRAFAFPELYRREVWLEA